MKGAAETWTAGTVRSRLEQAAWVERCRPCGQVRPSGVRSSWPSRQMGPGDHIPRPLPSPKEISCAEEAMDWLLWVRPAMRKLLWMKADGVSSKDLEREFNRDYSVLFRRCQSGWGTIAHILNYTNHPPDEASAHRDSQADGRWHQHSSNRLSPSMRVVVSRN